MRRSLLDFYGSDAPMLKHFVLLLALTGTALVIGAQSRPETLFRVRRIKSLKTVWLIYAQRNDSFFTIASLKTANDSCRNVRRQGRYRFKLRPFSNSNTIDHPSQVIYYVDGTRISTAKAPRHQLYTAAGLRGSA